jgi:hypothetical protein
MYVFVDERAAEIVGPNPMISVMHICIYDSSNGYVFTYTFMCTSINTYIHTCIHAYTYTYSYKHKYINVCIHIYIYIQQAL